MASAADQDLLARRDLSEAHRIARPPGGERLGRRDRPRRGRARADLDDHGGAAALELHARAALTATPSRIAAGFLASVTAIDGGKPGASVRALLVPAAAVRALDDAEARTNDEQDQAPLTTAQGWLLGAALRDDALSPYLAVQAAALIRNANRLELDRNAALACLAGPALDGQRAAMSALADHASASGGAPPSWVENVFWSLLGWSHDATDTADLAGTYCRPEFVTWAQTQAAQAQPSCAYGGVTFDRNDYCLE